MLMMIICFRLLRSTHCLARIDMTSGRAVAVQEEVKPIQEEAMPRLYVAPTVDFTAQPPMCDLAH